MEWSSVRICAFVRVCISDYLLIDVLKCVFWFLFFSLVFTIMIYFLFFFISHFFLGYNSSSTASFFSSFFLLFRLLLLPHFLPFFSSFFSFGPFPSYCFFSSFFFDPFHLIAFSCSSMNIKFFFAFLPIFFLPFFI